MSRKAVLSSETRTKAFPEQLRLLMDNKENPTTQEALAEKIGVRRQTVSNYREGQSSPDWETLCKIADFFNVSTDYLLGRTTIKSPKTDLQAVCQYLGLSEKAVGGLYRAKLGGRLFWPVNIDIDLKDGIDQLAHAVMDDFLSKEQCYSLFIHLAALKQKVNAGSKIIKAYNESNHQDPEQIENNLSLIIDAERAIKLSLFELTESIRFWADIDYSCIDVQDALYGARLHLQNVRGGNNE